MTENTVDVLRRYLQDVVAAERSFEEQLRDFAEEDGDEDVQAAFTLHAGQMRNHHERLAARLEELGGDASEAKSLLAHAFGFAPRLAQATHSQEERITQNLIGAYTIETAECAIHEGLAEVAQAAGDARTAQLAREIQEEERRMAQHIFHFIPSRAKISYNTATAWQIDPAVETKTADDRVI